MPFEKLVFTPSGSAGVTLAVAACRAGGVGVVNFELGAALEVWSAALERVAEACDGGFGIKLPSLQARDEERLIALASRGLSWVILDAEAVENDPTRRLQSAGLKVMAEVLTPPGPAASLERVVDALLLKGNEAGGLVGEDSSFILLQKWLGRTSLPLYLRGGLTPQVAAACHAMGVAGGVLDSQVLLLDEAHLPEVTQALLAGLSGNETVAVGDGQRGTYLRILSRPGHAAAKAFIAEGDGLDRAALRELASGKVNWDDPRQGLLPIGHDVCFASDWWRRHCHLAGVLAAFDRALDAHLRVAAETPAICEDAPLARALGVRYPIVQGPMTRVSDVADFAHAIAEGGGLPMVAFALLKGQALDTLLARTSELLGARAWGIGLLGFAPQSLLDEQLAIAMKFKPGYAIIAGGRPDQAVQLEAAGVPTFLHVPSANLIPLFIQEGARRFIFEGRECGGHVGPLSSFVLWSSMIDKLQDEIDARKVVPEELQLLFAGGIHDAVSSAMLQVMVAPLAARGVKLGVLMGSAYLFTREIVETGAIVPRFQREVIECERTVNLESGPGHASRCAYTPFARDFFGKRKELRESGVAADESRRVLDDLIMGRLRVASKGSTRRGDGGPLVALDEAEQHAQGMYMLGQVATLRDEITSIADLHQAVSAGAAALLAVRQARAIEPAAAPAARPADVAIVGVASLLPKANSAREFWENILAKVDGITEIPSHRWDWRLYFDADRNARDKIYSKWGGFLDDLAFDPTRYGMPPKSIVSVDPMQLMALEVARRTLEDAGYDRRPFDRERASVIVGASGGTGDVGSQYGLRSELPRFGGELPADVAARLPEWTEDTFAGILLNVIAGRIANRLNFGGVNFTTDAACGSSLAAVYQAVTELVSGRSDIVIAGGVDTVQGPFGYLCFSKTQALSPRGRCNTFDTAADGIVISEGIAMVALKRLADAERDGDRIYAVIKGVGGSSDGNAKGMTAPLPAGQLRAMRRAYAMAGFGPATVGLFEAHGTGTVAGDTAELESTTRLIREQGATLHGAAVGSVKTMIGHTKATAGIAGMLKAALALHHRVLPPHLGLKNPNRILVENHAPLYVVDEATPWLSTAQPRRAAVSAFGFGGTNFHIVLEEYSREYRPWMRSAASRRWPAELLLFAGADRTTLTTALERVAAQVAAMPSLALRDVAATLARHWRADGERLAVVARDTDELLTKLEQTLRWLRGEVKVAPPGVHHRSGAVPGGKVAILFPGQGSQYAGMTREIGLHFPVVAETIAQADVILGTPFRERMGRTLGELIFPRGAYDESAKAAAQQALTATDAAQPALGAVEVGLYRLMQTLGLRPDMLGGHSYGEFVAHHAAGAIDFDALMTLSAARGRFIVDAAKASGAELGTMAAVPAARKDVEDAIADVDQVIIANHNSPQQCILSGPHAAIRAATDRLAAMGIQAQGIPVAAAFHSNLVRPAQQALADMIETTPWQAARLPVYANSTARPHPAEVERSKRLMAEHLVQPVEFVAQIEAMHTDGARVFVEVGPKAVLSRLVPKILVDRPHAAVALDDGSGLAGLLGAVGQLLCAGIALDIEPLFAGRDCLVGEVDQLARLDRREPVPKTAWMINGSGVRRAADPVRQIGMTLEQVQGGRKSAAAENDSAGAVPAAAAAPSAPDALPPSSLPRAAARRTTIPSSARERPMDDRRTPPPTAEAVMSEYFETMRQFLETQERVMSAFMGQQAPGSTWRQGLRQRPAAVALPRSVVEVAQPIAAREPATAPAEPVAPAPIATAPAVPSMTTARVVAAAAPQSAPTSAPVVAAGPAQAGATVSRAQMTEMILAIIEDKTGYPKDMVGLDQNLEADLGIDSIKRIEVVGAMLQALPEAYRTALTDSRSKLNTQPTLNGMLELLCGASIKGEAAVPFDLAGTGAPVALGNHPSRHVIQAEAEPIDAATAARRLTIGRFVIAMDEGGVGTALATRLRERGCSVDVLDAPTLLDEAALLAWCRARPGPLAGVVHLAALDRLPLDLQASTEHWRLQLHSSEKSLFVLLRASSAQLADGAHVLAATALGGHYGRGGQFAGPALVLQGGSVGLLKSLREEQPGLRVKAVDTDPSETTDAIAATLLGELELDGGRIEVGYPGGRRTVFRTVAEPAAEAVRVSLDGIVVLATGGARGITAETLGELARPGNTLVLTGRSELPESEPAEIAALGTADALRRHFIEQVRARTLALTPAQVGRKVQQVLALREMRANIAELRRAGATIEYHAIDVTDEAAMARLLGDVYARLGRVDGVIHGAGVIEDKLLAEKSGDSWSRVVETKVFGLLLLARHLRVDSLSFLTVFSSVAGRYGNSGQSDYAAANELMNRLCDQFATRWDGTVNVRALCWGPWGPTRHGVGMVTAETQAKFAAKGVTLVDASLGREILAAELSRGPGGPVEVICGAGPWESHESEIGRIARVEPAGGGKPLGALLGRASVTSRPTGVQVLDLRLDERHAYLQEHAIDGTPVLPAAAALELLAEAAAALWPGWKVVEVRDFKLLKGVELKGATRSLQIVVSPPPYGSSEGFEVGAMLQSDLGEGRALPHYRGTVRLEQQLAQGDRFTAASHSDRSLSADKAYREWLFHGPRFQVIEEMRGVSPAGANCRVRSTRPAQWISGSDSAEADWCFDPALLDAAAQMAWLWSRALHDTSALPARFGRVVRYRERLPERLNMAFDSLDGADPDLVRGNVTFYDDLGDPVMLVEELESIASSALNRLGGTSRAAVVA